MTTKLEKTLRRELLIDRDPWVVTIDPEGLKLARKGRRKGVELAWKALVSGEAALAVALNASLRDANLRRPSRRPASRQKPSKLRVVRSRSRRN